MAHELEILNGVASLVFASAIKGKVWHGLGREVQGESFDLATGLREVPSAGQRVDVLPTYLQDGRRCGQGTVRADGAILASVGPTYTPMQTRDVAGALEKIAGKPLALQSLGVLDEGRVVFMQTPPVRTIEFANGKRWEVRLSAINGHDGARSLRFAACTTDMVCMNTVRAGLHEAEEEGLATRRRHTSGVKEGASRDARWLAKQLDQLDALRVGAAQALETPLTTDEQREVLVSLLGSEGKDGKLTTQSENAIERVLTLSEGVDLIGAAEHNPGSAYGLFAAITQYVSRELPGRASDAEKRNPALARANKHLASVLGLSDRSQQIVGQATQILLGVGA